MKIVQLTAENVKRLRAVTITPQGEVVQITGRNGQGKTSVLDSIAMALSGGDAIPAVPIRKGSKEARIVVKLDDMTVKRTFTAKGSYLTVESASGARYPSPQAMLDKIVGRLSFDPLAFARQTPKQQVETLRTLVGLDFSATDKRRADLYAERTAVNRVAKQLEGQLEGMAGHPDAPAAEVSVADLVTSMEAAQKANAANADVRRAAEKIAADVRAGTERLEDLRGQASKVSGDTEAAVARVKESLERKIEQLRREAAAEIDRLDAAGRETEAALAAKIEAGVEWLKQAGERRAKLEREAAGLADADLAPIRSAIADAEAVNRRVRENRERGAVKKRLDETVAKSDAMTAEIDRLDEEKRAALAAAAFPVPGLSFDDGGVLLNGLPFDQASGAEQLRVSVAMGLALNPKLRVLLIRDGSLLDADSLAVLGQMAEAADAQVWIERVADGGECGIVIEDGCVAPTKEEVAA